MTTSQNREGGRCPDEAVVGGLVTQCQWEAGHLGSHSVRSCGVKFKWPNTAEKDARIAELEAENAKLKRQIEMTADDWMKELVQGGRVAFMQARIASLEQVVRELTGAISQVVDVCSSEFHIDTYQFECFHVAKRAIKHSQEVLGEKDEEK